MLSQKVLVVYPIQSKTSAKKHLHKDDKRWKRATIANKTLHWGTYLPRLALRVRLARETYSSGLRIAEKPGVQRVESQLKVAVRQVLVPDVDFGQLPVAYSISIISWLHTSGRARCRFLRASTWRCRAHRHIPARPARLVAWRHAEHCLKETLATD